MTDDRVAKQLAFLVEADKLKAVCRRTPLIDGSRLENSAEHSWHLLLTAIVLREYTHIHCDLLRVLEMLIVHDLVEIDAGDTCAYDTRGQDARPAREAAAAERLFGLLPSDQGAQLRDLWTEFEACDTPESRLAHAVDRFQPLLQRSAAGRRWRIPYASRTQVLERLAPVKSALPDLWPTVLELIDSLAASGMLVPSPEPELD